MHLEGYRGSWERRPLRAHDPQEITEIYLALLLGDIQIRRVIGVTGSAGKSTTTMMLGAILIVFAWVKERRAAA